jgi:hypothetical protein
VVAVTHFLDGPRTVDAAADVSTDSLLLVANLISTLAPLAIAAGLLLVSLNAMRVGLLTRFMGVLAIIVGVTFVLPLDQQGIIRMFWLAALGLLFLGRWPSGTPKAWATGEAEPWPTQQQLREQRDAARAGREPPKAPAAEPEREPEPVPARATRAEQRKATPAPTAPTPRRPDAAGPGTAHSASKKKKRKRRT